MNTPAPQVEMVSELQDFLAANEAAYGYRPDVYAGVLTNGRDADRYMGWQLAQAALNARAGGDARDAKGAERYRWLRAKVGFSGNGDGTSSMFVINLPVRVAGWPEVGQHAEFIDAAIDSEIAALASQAVGVKDGR